MKTGQKYSENSEISALSEPLLDQDQDQDQLAEIEPSLSLLINGQDNEFYNLLNIKKYFTKNRKILTQRDI